MLREAVGVLVGISVTSAQPVMARQADVPHGDSLASKLSGTFAVPESPAFTLLATQTSNILRPASAKALALAFSDFVGPGTSIIIPKSFAVEFSPGLIIAGSGLTLRDYQESPWLYRIRISAATARDDDESTQTQIAFGVRLSVLDGADLRTNNQYLGDVTTLSEQITAIQQVARDRVGPPPSPIIYNAAEKRDLEALMDSVKQKTQNQDWNKAVFDIAFAARLSASDSLGKNLRGDRYAAWFTLGSGAGSWGQAVLGLNGGFERDTLTDDFNAYGSFAARFYVGTNRYKVLLEGQGEFMENQDPRWLLNSGGEALLMGQIWATFTGGLEYDRNVREWKLVTNLALRFGLPEL